MYTKDTRYFFLKYIEKKNFIVYEQVENTLCPKTISELIKKKKAINKFLPKK